MNAMKIELNGADQTASTEAKAANAANNDDKETVMTGEEDEDTSEVDSLIDFNDEGCTESIERNANEQRIYLEKHSQIGERERSLHFPIFERR
jgi:hypothetical protein